MLEQEFIDKLSTYKIEEKDINNWILPKVLNSFSEEINNFYTSLIHQNDDQDELIKLSFKEQISARFNLALRNFYINRELYKNGSNINLFLIGTLRNSINDIKTNISGSAVKYYPRCFSCFYYGKKSFLVKENKLLRCNICTEYSSQLKENYSKYNLCKVFSLHSRSGYRCPECSSFLPKSLIQNDSITCPFPNCVFVGLPSNLKEVTHPVGLGKNQLSVSSHNISLEQNSSVLENSYQISSLDFVEDRLKEFEIIENIINLQIKKILKNKYLTTNFQKFTMYQAFKNCLKNYPEEMYNFLVRKKTTLDFCVTSQIFQEYVRLLENNLPFQFKDKEIYSLLDPDLNLFLGKTEFTATVSSKYEVPNNTEERYLGKNNFKDFGNCYIGYLISIKDLNNNDLKKFLLDYSFEKIKLSNKITPGTQVKVIHYRTYPHYSLGHLVYFQQIRKNIIESIEGKLNK